MAWAFRLHRTLIEETGAVDRGLRRARFVGVLRWQKRPAVLLEAGYLSNPEEAKKVATASYRQLLAEAVAKALGCPVPKKDDT
jgi:N-acetylmuramoyl-L-alanine amidase